MFIQLSKMVTRCIDPRAVVPQHLPSVSLSELRSLPPHPALYLVLSGLTVVYVGQTTNLLGRWTDNERGHQKLPFLADKPDVSVAYICCPKDYLLVSEMLFIAYFDPILNITPGDRRRMEIRERLPFLGILGIDEVSDLGNNIVSDSFRREEEGRIQFEPEKDRFEKFWQHCGIKTGKDIARRNFLKATAGEDLDAIISALEFHKRWHLAKNGTLDYMPRPPRWLSQKMWKRHPADRTPR